MRLIFSILILFTIIGSAFICIKQPKMHSRVLVYDSQYTIVDNEKNTVEENIATEELPTMAMNNNDTKTETFFTEEVTPQKTTKTDLKEKKIIPNKVTTKQESKGTVKNEVKTNTKPQTVTTPKNTNTNTNSTQTKQEQNNKNTVTNSAKQVAQKQTPKVLTAQEEEIAWNVWRSNLQNQLMKDTHLPAIPLGTIFKVSFDVDKSGRISNVQTWSTNPKYTPYAIEHIAPVIRNYQGKSILDFPQGSQRTKTTFTGGWRISQNSRYSTPANYNDIEKVTK